ncbi:MAG: hypothetical protein AAGG72_07490 [Pseudomonadota bacterium]
MADNLAEEIAKQAMARSLAAEIVGEQLGLFGQPEVPSEPEPEKPRKAGRPKGSRNKAQTGLRELMVAQGYRDPASQLARIACLHTTDDPLLVNIGRAQAILAAAGASPKQIMDDLPGLVIQLTKLTEQAGATLMPYTFAKVTPDVNDNRTQMVVQIAAPGSDQAGAQQVRTAIAPPPMPSKQTQQNQTLSGASLDPSGNDATDGSD